MRQAIEAAERIVLITHINPDADSMGSACAMYAYLLRLQKKITLFCATQTIDTRLGCIPWSEKTTSRYDGRADLAIAFDCASYARLGVSPGCTLINVDHHATNEGYGDIRMVDPGAASTTMVLLRWLEEEGIRINPKMATALYAGLADDTVAFMSRRTDAAVFEAAAKLLRAGADVHAVHRSLFVRQPLSALRLKGLIFETMQLHLDGRVVVLRVSREMLKRSGAQPEDCESALHEAMGLPTVRVALLFREREDGSIRGSLRTDDGIDVSRIAAQFSGGGHPFAAGFIVEGESMATLETKVLKAIEKELE